MIDRKCSFHMECFLPTKVVPVKTVYSKVFIIQSSYFQPGILVPWGVHLQLPDGTWKDCGVAQFILKFWHYAHICVSEGKLNTKTRLQIGVRLIFNIFIFTMTSKLPAATTIYIAIFFFVICVINPLILDLSILDLYSAFQSSICSLWRVLTLVYTWSIFLMRVDRCNVMRGDRQSCQVRCASPLSRLSPIFFTIMVTCTAHQFPVNGHKVSALCVCVLWGKGKVLGLRRRNRG